MTTDARILEAVAPLIEKVLESFATSVAEELENDARNDERMNSDVSSALNGVAHQLQCADFAYIVREALQEVQ